MKILYAVNGTGNGHIVRARRFVPLFEHFGQVDTLISGLHHELQFFSDWTYRFSGPGFFFGDRGGIDYLRSVRVIRPKRFIDDLRSLPIDKYDLVVSDFEPLSAWACHFHHRPCVGLSNQCSFLSSLVPRPLGRPHITELLLRFFAPVTQAVGFHYQCYDTFIHTPIIDDQLRMARPMTGNHITVYLPAHSPNTLVKIFRAFAHQPWQIFSKHVNSSSKIGSITLEPVHRERFLESLISSHGLITAAGFETTVEALFLGKRLLVVPMRRQYEQLCNAEALRRLGVDTLPVLVPASVSRIATWMNSVSPLRLDFPDESQAIVRHIIHGYQPRVHVMKDDIL